MKLKSLFLGATAALALGSFAQAQTTTVHITGSSAFREVAHKAILSLYTNPATAVNYAYDKATLGLSSHAIFVGTSTDFPGVTLIVKTSFNGSIEGLRDVTNNANVKYLPDSTPKSTGAGTAGVTTTTVNETGHKITYSDVDLSAAPAAYNSGFTGGKVGVIVFAPFATANFSASNITQKQFQTLVRNGYVQETFFTGLTADDDSYVFATGRNDFSGTRTVALAEANIGDAALAKSYRNTGMIHFRMDGSPISTLKYWPAGDGVNASGVWSTGDADGNGGYNSGSTLATTIALPLAANVAIQDPSGDDLFGTPTLPSSKVSILTIAASPDAATAIGVNGVKFVSWNGVSITPTTYDVGLSATDRAKVANGLYTLWSYESLYQKGATGPELTYFNDLTIASKLATNIGGNGLTLTEMKCSRSQEGAFITRP